MNETTAASPHTVNTGEYVPKWKKWKQSAKRQLNPAPGSLNAVMPLLYRSSMLLDKSLPVYWKDSQVTITWGINLFSVKLDGLHCWSPSRPNCNLKAENFGQLCNTTDAEKSGPFFFFFHKLGTQTYGHVWCSSVCASFLWEIKIICPLALHSSCKDAL